ncbi:hypothetical protein G4B84_010013 [Aspergillus flavus NRRL3357]|nr:uncharacterized protein G4B84_010013 [Aspergillus flavus NRRL3357]QMW34547.1 hypothetical protein G4B84_010013 [Aspergillus flavus NRRL3357]
MALQQKKSRHNPPSPKLSLISRSTKGRITHNHKTNNGWEHKVSSATTTRERRWGLQAIPAIINRVIVLWQPAELLTETGFQVLITRHRRPGYGTKFNVPFFITTQEVKQAVRLGCKGFALTIDPVRAGKIERDLRVRMSKRSPKGTNPDDDEEEADGFAGEPSVGRPAVQSGHDWTSAIYKMASGITELPIAIKGIQGWEDATLCMDTAQRFATVDGGITRGADIVKAIALGARAVGLGRPFLYGVAFGEAGANWYLLSPS